MACRDLIQRNFKWTDREIKKVLGQKPRNTSHDFHM